jgi:phi13 family phage major tail protein
MAKIGLQNFLFGLLTEATDGTPTYGEGIKPGRAISCNVSITNNDAKLDADDVIAEADTSFQNGSVTLGVDDDDLETMAILLGHEITDGEIVRSSMDVAPYVGLGRIVTKLVGGVHKYKVEFLCKVKFAEPSQEDTTKSSDGIEFGTYELEGVISTLANGDWSKANTFDTMDEAKAYLNGLFGSASE